MTTTTPDPVRRTARHELLVRYETRSASWLMGAAIGFLAVYAAQVLWTDLPGWLGRVLVWVNVAVWVVFAVDLAVRLALAPRPLRYVLRHPIDVMAVALPMLRPLRVLRIFTAGHTLFTRGSGLVRTGQAVVFSAGLLIAIGALAILDVERDAEGATITTFGDALWWAMVTVTTVGYGDHYPVTGLGRAVAAALMVVGISVLGVVTASVAAWFSTERTPAPEPVPPAASGARDVRVGAAPDATHETGGGSAPSSEESVRLAQRLADADRLLAEGALTGAEHARVRERLLARAVEG
ncbi:MAG: potassium channel family protein [Actinotalea sp.]|nr:potassium channel family protein [Actinotalea sp.]